MNSVMDDNKLLTLANGERIRLENYCALLFEVCLSHVVSSGNQKLFDFLFQVGNLIYASPATVSRAGMVFVDPKNLGYEPYWQRWLSGRKGDEIKSLEV